MHFVYLMQNQLNTVRSSPGFTLIEMSIVLVVIGILVAFAAPIYQGFIEIQRLNAAQNQVYLAMREAQSKATQAKLTWQVSFREAGGVVQWAVHASTIQPTATHWHNLDSHVRLDSESTLEFAGGVRQIQFDYRGNVRQPPLGRITLSSQQGGKAKRCVYVSTILGAMRTAKEHSQPKAGSYCY